MGVYRLNNFLNNAEKVITLIKKQHLQHTYFRKYRIFVFVINQILIIIRT